VQEIADLVLGDLLVRTDRFEGLDDWLKRSPLLPIQSERREAQTLSAIAPWIVAQVKRRRHNFFLASPALPTGHDPRKLEQDVIMRNGQGTEKLFEGGMFGLFGQLSQITAGRRISGPGSPRFGFAFFFLDADDFSFRLFAGSIFFFLDALFWARRLGLGNALFFPAFRSGGLAEEIAGCSCSEHG